MKVMVIFGRQARHPDFPDAPLAADLARTPEDRKIVEILEIPYLLSRPFAAPPGVPADRAAVLRSAFIAAHRDPEYLSEAARMAIDVSPIDSNQILKQIDRISETPKDLLDRVEKLIQGNG